MPKVSFDKSQSVVYSESAALKEKNFALESRVAKQDEEIAKLKARVAKQKEELDDYRAKRIHAVEFYNQPVVFAVDNGIPVKVASEIFHILDTELRLMIDKAGIQPSGKYNRGDLFDIYELARLCVPPQWTDEEWETVLSTRHFPTQLVKDFWNAKKARQDYLLSAGELWATTEVASVVSEVFKTVAMGIKLIADNLDRETTLTMNQREIVNELIDETLRSAAKQINDTFSGRIEQERLVRFTTLTDEIVLNGTNQNGTTEIEVPSESETADESTYDITEL